MTALRILRVLLPAALIVLSLGGASTTASAYGSADQPLAQVELSANCDNPSIALCQPPPAGFGLGGIWVWVGIGSNGTADIAGAACGHDVAGPSGGAASIHFTGPWFPFMGTPGALYAIYGPPPAFFVAGIDPNNKYFVLPELGLAVPQTFGHYPTSIAPGAQIQLTIAP